MADGKTNSPRRRERKNAKDRKNECFLVGTYRDLSRQQQRIEGKTKKRRTDWRGCRRSFGTEVAAAIIEHL